VLRERPDSNREGHPAKGGLEKLQIVTSFQQAKIAKALGVSIENLIK
jgi:hypothetical protein